MAVKLSADLVNGFVNTLLIHKFDQAVATPDFHLELWDLMCSENQLVAAAAPRSHAKSTAITFSYALANIVFRTASHIMIVSDTEGQAVNFLGDIKNEFYENEELIAFFGVQKLLKDRETEIIVQFNDGHQARVIAKGSEQKLRGLKWRNKRPDLIICDDLENDEIVMNDERREKFRKWFQAALMPCGGPSCKIRVVGTILHLDSLLERLMPPLGDPNTIVEDLKQYSAVKRTWKSIRYKAHNEDFSKILWPEMFTQERLMAIRQSFIEQGFPEGYAQEYLNYPIDESTAYFKKRDILPISIDDEPEEYYMSGDLAISEKDRSAYTVFAVAGYTADNTLKIRDIVRFRGDALEIIDTMFDLYERYRPEIIFLEQENIARTLGPIIKKEMEERNLFPRIEPMTASQDKVKRARALQSRMRAGKVEFDTEAEWFPTLQNEFLQFPRGAYMDQVDAVSWIPLGIDKLFDTPTQEEMLNIEYEEEYFESFGLEGINKYTGY